MICSNSSASASPYFTCHAIEQLEFVGYPIVRARARSRVCWQRDEFSAQLHNILLHSIGYEVRLEYFALVQALDVEDDIGTWASLVKSLITRFNSRSRVIVLVQAFNVGKRHYHLCKPGPDVDEGLDLWIEACCSCPGP